MTNLYTIGQQVGKIQSQLDSLGWQLGFFVGLLGLLTLFNLLLLAITIYRLNHIEPPQV